MRPLQLQKTQISSVPLPACNATYYELFKSRPEFPNGLDDCHYCAMGPNNTSAPADSCQGDSGGPLQMFSSSSPFIARVVGVVSFGVSCGLPGIPGVYTRVAHYIPWIERHVWLDF